MSELKAIWIIVNRSGFTSLVNGQEPAEIILEYTFNLFENRIQHNVPFKVKPIIFLEIS